MDMPEKKIKEFVEKYKNIQLDPSSDPLTTWENNLTDQMLSPVVIRRYWRLLRLLNMILFGVTILLLIGILALSIKFIFFTNFEMFYFVDGTDLTCVLNPQTGVIEQNAK